MLKELARDGWVLLRTRGDHRQFRHPSKAGKVTVAGHLGDDVHPKTLASFRRQARMEDET
ncbi:type II toxin-antitoxin system HicA family toxin [Paludisphaera sp.]|uniref:type II toxin-antitoxin system HicA family toxin n=1 Tax=Paludisphaera sp. TaxID=2017432 RepID=UPI00301D0918